MEPLPAPGRHTRLALVAVALLLLLAIVAFATRSGFGGTSRATPSPGYVSYAFTAFLILFALMVPVALYMWLMQAREGGARRPSGPRRAVQNLAIFAVFLLAALAFTYLKRHHHLFAQFRSPFGGAGGSFRHRAARPSTYEPTFEWPVFWVAVVLLAAGAAYAYLTRRRRLPPRTPVFDEQTVADDLAATISDALDDLEAEPDARRAVIAAYARMEGVLARSGLTRRPSETPLEYLRRVLLGVTRRGDAVQRLTALFEQAKFSRHEIDASMKQQAIGALRAIRDDLQAAPA